MTHQSSSELEERLREKLRRLMGDENVVDGELVETPEDGVDSASLAKELGLEEVQTCSP